MPTHRRSSEGRCASSTPTWTTSRSAGRWRPGWGTKGTLEFFPEEGKYHLDGHRNCRVRLSPAETRAHDGLCPACGKPLTVGVMHRVEDLADRPEETAPPETAGTMQSLVPLPEILSEIHRVGPKSKRVAQHYESLLGRLGPELQLLNALPLEEIAPASSSLVAEAVARLRRREVIRQAGYDGVYGTIRLFEDAELHRYTRGAPLFGEERQASQFGEGDPGPASAHAAPRPHLRGRRRCRSLPAASRSSRARRRTRAMRPGPDRRGRVRLRRARGRRGAAARGDAVPFERPADFLDELDTEQRRAVETVDGALLIVAGPGSGRPGP